MKIDSLMMHSSAHTIFTAFPDLESTPQCNLLTGDAGTGKTALLTHIGLYFILRGYRILHVSLRDPQVHSTKFYDEIFMELSLLNPKQKQDDTGSRLAIERNRMIISTDDPCTVDFLEKRIQLLTNILDFVPHAILIDGYTEQQTSISELQKISRTIQLSHMVYRYRIEFFFK